MNKNHKSIVKRILTAILAIVVLGILFDFYMGFYVLRHINSVVGGIGALCACALLYILAELTSGWIHSKDDVSQPLDQRVLNLVLLLLFVGLAGGAYWLIFVKLDWWK